MMLALTLWIILLFPPICTWRIYEDGHGIFAHDKIELQVYENATVGSIVLPNLREYLHISSDRQVRLGPGAFSSFFSLAKNYSLLVQSSLDLESGDLCRAEESCCRAEDMAKEDNYLLYSRFTPSCKIRAVVLADNGESTPLKPIGRIVAIIQDLNDHAPEFILPKNDVNSVAQRIHIPFFEGFKGVGEKFQLPRARDKDFLPENSMLTYSIAMKNFNSVNFPSSARNEIPVSSGSPAWVGVGPFRLTYKLKEDALTLEVARELDRESQSEYELTLEAEDGEGQKATLIIQVHVLDVNEYEPKFVDVRPIGSTEVSRALDYSRRVVKIYENATVHLPFIQVIAEDRDAPPANQIAYKFSPSFHLSEAASVFSIDSNTGKISLERPLDFEEIKRYVVIVQATDANYELNVGEKKVLPHSLQKVTEAITNSIRKESKTATLALEIVVNDCNDHAPEIKLQGAVSNAAGSAKTGIDELTVMETAPPGTSLVFFSATDRDQGDAGVSQCHLLNWTEYFRIYNFSDFFSLETTKELDRELQSQYLLTIECFDNGNPRQYSQKRLRVILLDVNDAAPTFQHAFYSFHVLENSSPKTKLIPVSDSYINPVVAFDRDINSTITYHLEPISTVDSDQRNMFDYQLFDVDTNSGTLYTKSKLDREQRANHKFNLCANDGIHKTCTSIIVHLDDVNDNPPLFDKETYIIRLVENTQFYEPLITFHVTDMDSGNQGFSIIIEAPQLTGNASDMENATDDLEHFFSIRDNKLFLRQPLDREAKSHYHFFVRVTDLQNFGPERSQEGLSSTAEVFVEVCDTNDNAPVFVFPNTSAANEGGNQLNVSCRETMGSSVGRVVAVDLDLEQNGTVVYSVIQGPVSNELFYLDKQSGELFVNSGRLSENCDSVFLLVISADDMGPPSSKMGRPIPVERLLIRLKDQPTLAEYMSLNSQQPTTTKGRSDSRGDKKYFGLPAKTMLSVVLGGCIVFLTGLFLAWLILTLISRSKRRRRERREETPCQPIASHCCEARTLLSDGKHEVFIHPTGTFPHGLGPNGNRQFIQCTLGEKDEGLGLRELNTDESMSSRASPYGQSASVDTSQPLNTGGLISRISSTNIGSQISRSSPMNFKTAVNLNAVEQAGWNKMAGTNAPGTNTAANLSEEENNFVVVPGDAVHVSASACSSDSARYLLFPALSTPSTAVISMASTLHNDAAARSLLRPSSNMGAHSSSDPRRRSQCACEENKEKVYQSRVVNRSFHPFLTPPPKRKTLKTGETDEVLENVHIMCADNQYTPLAESSASSQVPCENQYLIITRRGAETAPVYNAIGRPVLRGSSLPRSLPGCSWSLEQVGEKQTVLDHIDEVSGVFLVPTVSSPSHSPNSGMNNSVRSALHPKSLHRFEEVNPSVAPATPHLRADYVSLEDLFSSCV